MTQDRKNQPSSPARPSDDRTGRPPRDDAPQANSSDRRKEGYRSAEERVQAAEERLALLEKKMPGLSPRRAALDVLTLLRKGRTLDHALQQCRTFNVLTGSDRALARNLVSTILRNRGAIDDIVGQYLDRPLPEKSIEVQDILRLATSQLLFLDIPPHAAVATAVELASEKRETAGYKNLVNAIARKISDKGKTKLAKLPTRVNTPGWLWRAWERNFGGATARKIAEAHQHIAPLDLIFQGDADPALFAEHPDLISLMSNHVRLTGVSNVPELPGFNDGKWWVQDLAASLPARLAGNITGKQVLDLCAAPGGKTLQLAAMGAQVTAVDISTPRLRRVTENLARTGLTAELITADILEWTPPNSPEVVLLDAPCSATGTIRRNPDVIWSKREDEVRQLARLQTQFIDRSLGFLKPGGLLIYCVCSLQKEEGEDQAKAVMARHKDITVEPVKPEEIGNLPGLITQQGYLRTLPGHLADKGSMDGFFAMRLRKA